MALVFDVHGRTDPGAETVLLSSGLGGSASYWTPQIPTLAPRYRVITYDHRGTGRNSGTLPDAYSIDHMAEEVEDVLTSAGGGACHFVGHALGGLIGMALVLRDARRVKTLSLVNAWPSVDSHTRRCFDARLALLDHAGVEAYVRAQPIFLYPAAWLSANVARMAEDDAHGIAHFQGGDTLKRRVGALLAFDAADRLGALALPVWVAASRDDVLVPWTCSRRLAESIPAAVLTVVEAGGHAFTVTEPDAFNADLMGFLAGHTHA